MMYRYLGLTGVKVSPLCLGAGNFGGPTSEEEARRIIRIALDGGINIVDTADAYKSGRSEEIVGRAINSSGMRDKVIVATKFGSAIGVGPNDKGASRRHIIRACENSLRRLDTNWIDLYQIHRPDLDTALEETLGAIEDLVAAGKVRYAGCSTFPAWMIMEALAVGDRERSVRLVSEQPPYNLLDRRIENELVPFARRHKIALLPWSPTAGGILAGNYIEDTVPAGSRLDRQGAASRFGRRVTDGARRAAARVLDAARRRGLTAAQVSLLWCKDQPGITCPIFGPRTVEHVTEALAIMGSRCDGELAKELDEINPPGCAVSDFHNSAPWMSARIS